MNRTLGCHPSLFRGLAVLGAGAALFALLAGCGGNDNKVSNPPPGNGETISIVSGAASKGGNAFSPNPDTVTAGATVRWVNNDGVQHTVTSDTPGIFNMSVPPGGSASRQFTTAGNFPYHCAVMSHTMQGSVVVIP
jgi:plastocyanin